MGVHTTGDAGKTCRTFAEHLGVAGGDTSRNQPLGRMGRQGRHACVPGGIKCRQEREKEGLGCQSVACRGIESREETSDICHSGTGRGNAVGYGPRRPEEPPVKVGVAGHDGRDDIGVKGGDDNFGCITPALQRVDILRADKDEITFGEVVGDIDKKVSGATGRDPDELVEIVVMEVRRPTRSEAGTCQVDCFASGKHIAVKKTKMGHINQSTHTVAEGRASEQIKVNLRWIASTISLRNGG